MRTAGTLIAGLWLLLMVNGCSSYYYYQDSAEDDDIVDVSYVAAKALVRGARQPLPYGSLIVVNSLVNVKDMEQTLALGRIMSDQLASGFHQAGFLVMGMELPTQIFHKNDQGILQLPDETRDALNQLGAKALLIGTYAPGKNNVYLSLRLVDIDTGSFISTSDFSIGMGPDAKALVKPLPKEEKQSEEPLIEESVLEEETETEDIDFDGLLDTL